MKPTNTNRPRWLALIRPAVSRFHDDFWFIIPAFAVTAGAGTFSVAGGWLKWHVEIVWRWPNEKGER